MSDAAVLFRVTYERYGELQNDVTQQMARGGLLVRVTDATQLAFDAPVALELVLPDGATLRCESKVLQQLAGHGVAVTVGPELVEQARAAGGSDAPGAVAARHERIDPGAEQGAEHAHESDRPPSASARPPVGGQALDGLTNAQKIHMAMHGTRDERNAILRDRNRTLHPFVLKNPQLGADDVLEICKNAQIAAEMLKQVATHKEWFQRPAIALALARNPKTPPALAVRALDHVSDDALRMMAKGTGVLPHVAQAARKKVIGK